MSTGHELDQSSIYRICIKVTLYEKDSYESIA